MKRCPNCNQLIDGEPFYRTETGIYHCGCYWDCDPLAMTTCENDVELKANRIESTDIEILSRSIRSRRGNER